VERELPFTWLLTAGGETCVVHGAIDLVARVDGALEVLDFKSHANPGGREAEIAEGYALQRDVYAAALAAIVEGPQAFSFFFPATGTDVRRELDDVDVARSREVVADLLSRAQGEAS
jgi:hypothetical protein